MSWKSLITGLILMAGVLWSEPAHASFLSRRLSLPEMVSHSEAIFIARVVSLESARVSDRGEIFTTVRLQVQSSLKGRPAADGSIRIHVPGGQVGQEIEVVNGAPVFAPGEQVLVFLVGNYRGMYQTVGMAQGKYAIEVDPVSSQRYAVHDLSGLYFLVPDPLNNSVQSVQAPEDRRPLGEMLYEVRQLLDPPVATR